MNLIEIRTKAAQQSGRYDLVNPSTFVDNGMDFHIKSGQLYLDKKSEFNIDYAHLTGTIEDGDYYIELEQRFKSLTSVFINDGTTNTELTYIPLDDLSGVCDAADDSIPTHFSYASYRSLKTAESSTLDEFINLDWDGEDYNKPEWHGLIVAPASGGDYTLSVSGKFFPKELSAETDDNYWTTEYPNLLIMATLRSISVFSCDFQSVAYWSNAIHEEIVLLGFNEIDTTNYLYDRIM